MRRGLLCLLLTTTACVDEADEHFRKTADLMCRMRARCDTEAFSAVYENRQECADEAEVGVALYAERCEDFDPEHARECRKLLRRGGRRCSVDTDDPDYEEHCLSVCSNFQVDPP